MSTPDHQSAVDSGPKMDPASLQNLAPDSRNDPTMSSQSHQGSSEESRATVMTDSSGQQPSSRRIQANILCATQSLTSDAIPGSPAFNSSHQSLPDPMNLVPKPRTKQALARLKTGTNAPGPSLTSERLPNTESNPSDSSGMDNGPVWWQKKSSDADRSSGIMKAPSSALKSNSSSRKSSVNFQTSASQKESDEKARSKPQNVPVWFKEDDDPMPKWMQRADKKPTATSKISIKPPRKPVLKTKPPKVSKTGGSSTSAERPCSETCSTSSGKIRGGFWSKHLKKKPVSSGSSEKTKGHGFFGTMKKLAFFRSDSKEVKLELKTAPESSTPEAEVHLPAPTPQPDDTKATELKVTKEKPPRPPLPKRDTLKARADLRRAILETMNAQVPADGRKVASETMVSDSTRKKRKDLKDAIIDTMMASIATTNLTATSGASRYDMENGQNGAEYEPSENTYASMFMRQY